MIETATHITFVILLLALAITIIWLIKGPTLPDRVISLDLVASLTMGIIISFIFMSNKIVYINTVLIIAPIFFLGTVVIAKYLKTKARND
ncbi:monovalent cation/H+ antiporter complex subunit F [Fulvivirga imtechensis]|uniref:monovalent cation/H+ antiporter complex subunit F n=1 Tax=Fulvivirga imtechensis TaxID=881893 RepID=UPI000590EEAF|nr:monovalent cation/H+ antiporter complex subunit F [Fulvivirga imtechensis]